VILDFVGCACHSLFGSGLAVPRIGSYKMNEITIVIFMVIAGALWAVMAYAVGFKEGQRQGYTRGRAVSRHISQLDKAAK
jgi:hypothetical protein